MILTGRRVTAEEAKVWGLVDRVAENPEEEAKALANQILEGGPVAINVCRELLRPGSEKTGPYLERDGYKVVLTTKDRDEALQAFAAKRKPVFRGE